MSVSGDTFVVHEPLHPEASRAPALSPFFQRRQTRGWSGVTRVAVTSPAPPVSAPPCLRGRVVRRAFFSRLTDKTVKDYSVYRSSLLFWALVDLTYNMFKVRTPSETRWVAARVFRDLCCWL